MAANTGRTNAKWIQVFLDNSAGTLTEITAYVRSVGTMGLTYDTTDVTAYADLVKNFTVGQPGAPITLSGPFDTTLYAMLIAYNTNGRQTSSNDALSFNVLIGIQHAWEAGEPTFGITGSKTSGYQITSFTVDTSAMTWQATLEVVGSVAPAWNTLSYA
jgi:hypothetical protein